MSDNDRAGRILGGRGTHNRPWIIDDDEEGTAVGQQQQQQQEPPLHQPFRMAARTNSGRRRASTSSIASDAASTSANSAASTGSSYDRYLAQRRAEAAAANTATGAGGDRMTVANNESLSSRSAHGSSYRSGLATGQKPRPQKQQPISSSTAASRQRSSSDQEQQQPRRQHAYTSSSTIYQQYQEYQRSGAVSAPSSGDNGTRRILPSTRDTVGSSQRQTSLDAPATASRRLTATTIATPSKVHPPATGASELDPAPHQDMSSTSRRRLQKGSTAEGDDFSVSSRDLRSKRLAQQRQDALNSSSSAGLPAVSESATTNVCESDALNTTSVGDKPRVPQHFQAHDAAVEKYLMRSRLADAGRSRTVRNSNATGGGRPPSASTTTTTTTTRVRGEGVHKHPSVGTSQTVLSQSDGKGVDRSSSTQSSRIAIASNRDHVPTVRTSTASTVRTEATAVSSSRATTEPRLPLDAPATTTARGPATTGWSTIKRASTTGHISMTSEAVIAHEAYNAETAAAAVAMPASSGSSKVDQYLAQRHALKQRTSGFSRMGKKRTDTAVSTESLATLSISSVPSTAVSFEASTDEESSESESEREVEDEVVYEDDGGSEDGADVKEWSVKVCVVSAVDFPASVVPNLPFSPFLKVGLVNLKATEEIPQGENGASSQVIVEHRCRELTSLIERDGMTSIPRSRVRCTSSKILSKRDNGSVEFHEEMRWDGVKQPQKMALALELSSRAVLTPANIRESPPQQNVGPFQLPASPHHSIGRGQTSQRVSKYGSSNDPGLSGLGSLFRKIRNSDSAEMEEANAAAAVAKLLVQGDDSKFANHSSNSSGVKASLGDHQSEIDCKLRRRKKRKTKKMTEELRLGAKVIPLTLLPLVNAMNGNETVRIEQWFELDTNMNTVRTSQVGTSPSSSTATRNPSILLEISFSAPEVLDDSEDDMEEEEGKAELKASYAKRASLKIRNQLKQEVKPQVDKVEEPMLEPGLIDFICVVGARDIGDQKADDGSRGWVNSTPECCILEQFPPNDEFHLKNGRTAVLPGKVEWFCFPEGCRLWRGLTPPNHDELNLKRFSASSPAQVSNSIASFDACLGCTTSFSWFAISSNSDKYGSESKKTYGAVIRFFVPAPTGIDPTQDDFAQTVLGTSTSEIGEKSETKRLWIPIGICMTAGMPIIGTMEVMLLRLCESLSSTGVLSVTSPQGAKSIHEALVSVIISYQKPIPGVVNCSFPFLEGERLHIALPPRTGLPALPHGNAVASVCRLLGADGLNYLLAAFLTECKILLHSDEVSNLSLVAEVMTSLLYPFQWSLPYVPVLPAEMMEFLEAPVSFLLGVPSCNILQVDPTILEDIVVVDLDRDFSSSDYFEGRRNGHKSKSPVPLPAAVASNIAKAVYRLIRAEEEVEDTFGASNFPGSRSFPRTEPESLPEREFRISVALEVCGLIRGYDECLVFSSSLPVFNVDKFLQVAPAIFEEQRGTAPTSHGQSHGQLATRTVISPRSRRFVSILVCCQHFHQFLEVLEAESLAFFHAIMRSLQLKSAKRDSSLAGMLLSLDSNQNVVDLCKALQNVEDKTPTYRVKSYGTQWPTILESTVNRDLVSTKALFPFDLLQQILVNGESQQKEPGFEGVKSVSLEYLVELEKNPWRYQKLLNLNVSSPGGESTVPAIERIKIREAIGDRRYRAWKSGYDKFDSDETSVISEECRGLPTSLDLISLLTSVTDDMTAASEESESGDSRKDPGTNAKDRDVVRRCLESAKLSSRMEKASQADASRDLEAAAEDALQNPSAQKFLLAVLSKRTRNDIVTKGDSTLGRRRSIQSGGSKLDPGVFDVLVRLSFAMLDSCNEMEDFESAYSLLKLAAGLYAVIAEVSNEVNIVYLTERIGLHPIYADLELWEKVKNLHATTRQQNHGEKDPTERDKTDERNDEYEAVVGTLYEMNGYGIPAEELARFASRMCENNDWFHSEKGQNLLMLAKRVCIRRDHGPISATPAKMSDLELISPSPSKRIGKLHKGLTGASVDTKEESIWVEVGWCHPAARSSRRAGVSDNSRRPNQNVLSSLEENGPRAGKESGNYMRRSAVTSMVYLGSSVVVTGGLDGGVFMARKVLSSRESDNSSEYVERFGIRGVHLDWGSSGSRYTVGSASTSLDGEYGVGAVTCLAATRSALGVSSPKSAMKDVVDPLEDEDVLEAMEGSRVVAGTTCGDLRVWSVKDVFSAVFYANRGSDALSPTNDTKTIQRGGGGSDSSFVTGRTRGGTDFAAGSSLTRLKFSLRGRALSGHRGGVSCIDVHSNVYRPDSIVSGGADGLIKLWSLRTPGASGGRRPSVDPVSGSLIISASHDAQSPASKAARSGDALSILSGHGGRILCLKTAWHGDRLLSGGADRTVRLWDLAGSGGKCLNSLSGHLGWVTSVQYWGPNTIISASTDRSVALWDVRVRNSPLFMLRHHYAPVSDILVGPRSDPVMVSAAVDGSVAAWDFRHLTGATDNAPPKAAEGSTRQCKVVRNPAGKLYMHKFDRSQHALGAVRLSKGVSRQRKTALCLGSDAIIREWDYQTGDIVNEHATGHCDTVSSFVSLGGDKVLDTQLESLGPDTATATISASWDGTVRMRSLVARK